MAGTKKIRYQWMWHQLESKIRESFNADDMTKIPADTALFWTHKTEGYILDYMDILKHLEYERVFDEEAYENKIKRSDARKGH